MAADDGICPGTGLRSGPQDFFLTSGKPVIGSTELDPAGLHAGVLDLTNQFA